MAASTASTHVARLEAAGLVTVRADGRERLVALAGHEVAEAVEALTLLTGEAEVRSLRAAGLGDVLGIDAAHVAATHGGRAV